MRKVREFKTTAQERFLNKVEKTKNCWVWMGAKMPKGYGRVTLNGKGIYAHRLSYLFFNGPIGKNQVVMHTCDNSWCVNPEHLKIGTQKENIKDCVDKKRFMPGHRRKNGNCRKGLHVISEVGEFKSGGCKACARIKQVKAWRLKCQQSKNF